MNQSNTIFRVSESSTYLVLLAITIMNLVVNDYVMIEFSLKTLIALLTLEFILSERPPRLLLSLSLLSLIASFYIIENYVFFSLVLIFTAMITINIAMRRPRIALRKTVISIITIGLYLSKLSALIGNHAMLVSLFVFLSICLVVLQLSTVSHRIRIVHIVDRIAGNFLRATLHKITSEVMNIVMIYHGCFESATRLVSLKLRYLTIMVNDIPRRWEIPSRFFTISAGSVNKLIPVIRDLEIKIMSVLEDFVKRFDELQYNIEKASSYILILMNILIVLSLVLYVLYTTR